MRALMGYIHEHAPPTAHVSLMADHGTPECYERYGFQPSLLPDKAGMFLRIASHASRAGRRCKPSDVVVHDLDAMPENLAEFDGETWLDQPVREPESEIAERPVELEERPVDDACRAAACGAG